MKSVGSLLSSIFQEIGIEDKIVLTSLQKNWRSIFDEPLSIHTYPADIKKGELIINVDSPAWLSQLKFFTQDIIKKLSSYNIISIKFKYGQVYRKGFEDSRSQVAKKSSSQKLRPSEIQWIEQAVSEISDVEVKEAIKKAIEKSLQPTDLS